MVYQIKINSTKNNQFIDISSQIKEIVKTSGIQDGICYVYVPHTTAGLTINENADPDVVDDMIKELNKIVPLEDNYKHFEGNAAAHIKSSMMGFSENIIINNGKLMLGTWQGIYFTEFDGPRNRSVYVKILK